MEENPGLSLFQAGNINVENALQNQEEEEDLEDQKRRQEEIQSLLTKAMDDFNYDDQSTMNSSTNLSIDEYNYAQKYKDAAMDDQLKVLYEVRVREVQSLTNQVESLRAELEQQTGALGKKFMLAESEKNHVQISLRQSQELLVMKSEEIAKLQKDIESCYKSIAHLEDSLHDLTAEHDSVKHVNKDLMQQLTIMQRGITTNSMSERQFQEQHQAELTKVQHNLDNAMMKIERMEKTNNELELKLRQNVREKDEFIMEKSEVINKLTENLEDAQLQCRDLLQLVDKTAQENQTLKKAAGNYDLVKKMSDKTEIIKVLQKELDKANSLQNKHLSEYQKLQQDCTEISKKLSIVENDLEHFKTENHVISAHNQHLTENLKEKQEQILALNSTLEKFSKIQLENEILLKQVDSLQGIVKDMENKSYQENAMQVSQIMTSFCEQTDLYKDENVKLRAELEQAKTAAEYLASQLSEHESEIGTLKLKVTLEHEREELIKVLQEKANQFEKIILEKQVGPVCMSSGTNTEYITESNNEEILRAEFEAQLIENEIKIRNEVTNEFQSKLEKQKQNKSVNECQNCNKLLSQLEQANVGHLSKLDEIAASKSTQVPIEQECQECPKFLAHLKSIELTFQKQKSDCDQLKQQQKEDRQIIANILEDWRDKFQELETQNRNLTTNFLNEKKMSDDLQQKLKLREKGDSELLEQIQKEAENLVKKSNIQAISGITKFTKIQLTKISESQRNIEMISRKADKRVKEIELMYSKELRSTR